MIWLLITWFGSSLLLAPFCYALYFGYFQNKYPTIAKEQYKLDRKDALVVALLTLLGPHGAIAVLILSKYGKYGLKWW